MGSTAKDMKEGRDGTEREQMLLYMEFPQYAIKTQQTESLNVVIPG